MIEGTDISIHGHNGTFQLPLIILSPSRVAFRGLRPFVDGSSGSGKDTLNTIHFTAGQQPPTMFPRKGSNQARKTVSCSPKKGPKGELPKQASGLKENRIALSPPKCYCSHCHI